MSRTYRRTYKGNKKTYLPPYNDSDLNGGISYGYCWGPNPKAIEWYKKNPHRVQDADDYFHWMTTPSWWNRLYHTRPMRRKEKQLLQKVKTGYSDPDDVAWPVYGKPHKYYW